MYAENETGVNKIEGYRVGGTKIKRAEPDFRTT